MSIEIGSKWVKDGEVVEVVNVGESYFGEMFSDSMLVIWFTHSTKTDHYHVLTERDFLKQYKPYEPIEEWQWLFITHNFKKWNTTEYLTEEEFKDWQGGAPSSLEYQRLDFTKRERKCTH